VKGLVQSESGPDTLYTIKKLYRLALLSWKRMRIAREEGRALRVFQWTG
jgi:hypothetical protein